MATARLDDIVEDPRPDAQHGTARLDDIDPLSAQPERPEDLPSREQFESSHQAAVADLHNELNKARPAGPTIGPAAAPSFLERLKRMVLGNPQGAPGETDTPVGRALGISYEAPAEQHTPTTDLPLVRPTALAPGAPESVAGGIGKGALQFTEGMTTAPNLLMMAGSGGLGVLGNVSKYLPRAVSAGFSIDMLRNAYKQYPRIRDAIDRKDWPTAAAAITEAGLTAGMGAAAGVHAVRGGPRAAAETTEPDVAKAAESARAGAEALATEEETPRRASLDDIVAEEPQSGTAKLEDIVSSEPGGRRVTGSSNPPLNDTGREQSAALAEQGSGNFDRVYSSPMDRAMETARMVDPNAQPDIGLGPWKLGEHEGQPADRERAAIDKRIVETPDEAPEGVGQHSGEPGESFNAAKDRFIGTIQSRATEMQPGERVLNVTHGRQIRMLQAWAKAGFPEDGSIDTGEMTRQGNWPEPARLLYLDPEARTLVPVDSPDKPGMYFARHGETDFSEGSASPSSNEGEKQEARAPSVAPAYGREVSIAVPGEKTNYPARYAVRELADVQPSHNPFSFEPNREYAYRNDRDYTRAGNAARVVKNASEGTFNPSFLTTDAPTAEHGTPVVDANGNALGGNSRTMTLARVYKRGGADADGYRAELLQKAQQFGIDPAEIERFQKPVLAREVGGGIDAQKAITDFNKAAAAELTPEERAVSDGRHLSLETIQAIGSRLEEMGEDGTLAGALRGEDGAEILNRLVKDGIVTEQEKGGYLDDKDNLTPEAKARIGKALVGRLYDSPAEYRATTPEMRAKLERIAPQILRVEGRPEWELTDRLREAVGLAQEARAHKLDIDQQVKQSGIWSNRQYSPEAVQIAKALGGSPVRAAARFRRYANDEALSRPGAQSQMFEPPTRDQAFQDAFGAGATERGSVSGKPSKGSLPEWLLTGYQYGPASGTSVSVPGAPEGAGPTPPATGPNFNIGESSRRVKGSGERGSISGEMLGLGVPEFIKNDVVPAVKRVATDLVEAKDQALRMVAPQLRGEAAEYTGLSLRQRMAQFARRYDQGMERLKAARELFNNRSKQANYDFIDDVEHGLGRSKQGPLDEIARPLARMLDQRRREVQALGEGELEKFYTNYFGHIFERPEQATKFFESFFAGKRSMEGPKSFLKHREFPTFKEALAAGLKPVSDNPVDLVMMKVREMDRYLLAHAVLRDLADRGIAKRVSGDLPVERQGEMFEGAPIKREWAVARKEDLPPGFVSIRDPIGGGGKWYAEQGAADALNNYLTPGLRARSGAYRILAGVNNAMNQANLGLSAFHLTGEVIRSGVSRAALGIEDLLHGKALRGSLRIATFPAAPFLDYVNGSKVLHDWFTPGSEGAPIAAITDALTKGGGRVRMDAAFATNATDSMMKALREGNFPGALIRAPWALLEQTSKPMMEHIIPRLKLGVFHGMAADALERLGPGANVESVRKAMAPIWDSVDNRMGQVVYDNLFLNRTFKDILHLIVRSVGWNLGTLREIGGGTMDLLNLARGRRPDAYHRLAYTLALPMVSGMIGALYQYGHTGKGPRELKDYFFPKRENGQRIALPTDVKDVYHYGTDPVRTVENKTSPLANTVIEMLHNRDFYDRPIRNSDDPFMRQMLQEADFVARQFMPFTLQPRMGKKLPEEPNPEHRVENYLGFTKAPANIQGAKRRRAPKSPY
ncbi:MAG TPA: histidine phosphatase family protein [Bryobacteraceae bacterium]|nr:histidine phosphatase family protein [Bryobacteraceae bacterium]